MCVELRRRDGKFQINLATWYFVLELGCLHGWEPRGARRRGRRERTSNFRVDGTCKEWEPGPHKGTFTWYNGYILGDGRKVLAEDASALAEALTKALPYIPEHDALAHKPRAYPMPAAMWEMLHDMSADNLPSPDQYVNGVDWFSGDRKQLLRDCIAFLRNGGFSIWP